MKLRLKTNTAQVQAVATTSTAAVAFAAKPGELVYLQCSTDAYLHIGASGLAAASATVHTLQLSPETPIALRLNTGDTHFRVIRVAADGVLSITRLQEDTV